MIPNTLPKVIAVFVALFVIFGGVYLLARWGNRHSTTEHARVVTVAEMTKEERLENLCDEIDEMQSEIGREPKAGDTPALNVARTRTASLHELACGY